MVLTKYKEEEIKQKMELRGGMKSMRSFGKPENRKLGNFLIVSCTVLSLCILSLVKTHYCPSPYVEVKSSTGLKLKVSEKAVAEETAERPPFQDDEDDEPSTPRITPVCYESGPRSETCEAEGDIRVQGSSRTVFMVDSSPATPREWTTKPYARKHDAAALAHVREWTLKPSASSSGSKHPPPLCTKNHTAPAVVFSIGGFTGNLFHDFTDLLVPLYITTRRFRGDVHLLVSDTKPWWLGRFGRILSQLSVHEVVATDSSEEEESRTVRCFPRATVGLTFENELGVDTGRPNRRSLSMSDFRGLVRAAFGLERDRAMTGSSLSMRRPRLLIISRRRSRRFVNEKGIEAMASSLGFDVRVGEPDMGTDVARFARLVNSADVLLGVHGAGLTNMVYLPEGAVVVQVVPLGGLEWIARGSFGEPAGGMNVTYMEYRVSEEESSLVEVYGRGDRVIRDPRSVHREGWARMKEVYLDRQNVRLHLGRLRDTLLKAKKILPPFN